MMQGIRQGGVLSGKLYLLHINSILPKLSESNLGAAVMDLSACLPTKADDLALISSRLSALREDFGGIQQRLEICTVGRQE